MFQFLLSGTDQLAHLACRKTDASIPVYGLLQIRCGSPC